MTDELSIIYLILTASIPVQLVMLSLVVVSLISWTMILNRRKEYKLRKAAVLSFEERFWSGIDLSRLYVQINQAPDEYSGQENIFRAGFKEFVRLRQSNGTDSDAVMEGAQRAMRVAITREQEKLERHLSFLATAGSTSPYLGLFGTVWGIMNSFLSLAQAQQATISVVAPDIAEALIATAMGLFAAIPAVIAYNNFSSKTDSLLISYDTFADEFSSILHRKAHIKEVPEAV